MSETTNENNSENVELKSVPRVGDQLRSLRESKGYSLKYISQQTKISVRILENIESSNFKELPNKTYVTGFLRSYCRILGTDANSYIDNFCDEADQNASNKKSIKPQGTENYQSVSQKQVMAVLGLIIVAGVFVGIFKFIENVSDNEPNVVKNDESIQLETITASTPLAKEEEKVESATEPQQEPTSTDDATPDVVKANPAETTPPKDIKPAPEQTSLIDMKKQEEKLLAQQAAEQKAAEERAEQEKAAAEKLAKEKAEKEKADQLAAQKAADQKAAKEAADQKEAEKKAAAEKLAKEKAEKEKADKLAAQKLAEEKKAKEAAAKKEETKKKDQKKDEKEEEVSFSEFQLPLYQFDTVDVDDIPEDELPKTYRQSVIKGKQNLFINALEGDTWITYKSDDQKVRKFVLKQGRRILIRGEVIRLFMGNVNVAKMFLNNRPLIVQSKSGVRSLVFPQELSTNYKIPLFIYKKDGTVETSEEYLNRQENSEL